MLPLLLLCSEWLRRTLALFIPAARPAVHVSAALQPCLLATWYSARLLPTFRPALLLPALLAKCRNPRALAPLQLVFRHITADIKNSNKKQRNERLNRAVQNFMYRRAGWWGRT